MQKHCGKKYKFITCAAILGSAFILLSKLAEKNREPEGIDSKNPYLSKKPEDKGPKGFYVKYGKRMMDKGISFLGLVTLAPLYGLISLAVYLDDPGPVIFTQKRVGKGKHFIEVHKFRSMKMSTPHDVPTHLLKNPEEYITKVGRFLRKSSLDELPQVWDIFRGKMSIIGPRPALWNQEDLVAEREKYGANDIMPGLTGWAQINGRDELEIPVKAKLDGDYAKGLSSGGIKAFLQDIRCFLGTVKSVLKNDGVVEGGTGAMNKNMEYMSDEKEAGVCDYGYKKKFTIDRKAEKRVLVTGAGSYIGESFKTYASIHYPNITTDVIDMENGAWREHDFTSYDAVFHVAGIAHADTGMVSEEEKKRYYAVNTDLAVETAETCKKSGVRQFILMSSMIIYGDSAFCGKKKVIDEHTMPEPANFYGDSKWQADLEVRKLQTGEFKTAVLRPPMVYGKDSKGNYQTLAALAKKLPFFPEAKNSRSMIYIENFCEFVCQLVLSGEGGIYFPQNKEYSSTCRLVKEIAKATGHTLHISQIFNPLVSLAMHIPGKAGKMADKAFGNFVYSQKLSVYDGLDYQVADLEESIKRTEGKGK